MVIDKSLRAMAMIASTSMSLTVTTDAAAFVFLELWILRRKKNQRSLLSLCHCDAGKSKIANGACAFLFVLIVFVLFNLWISNSIMSFD